MEQLDVVAELALNPHLQIPSPPIPLGVIHPNGTPRKGQSQATLHSFFFFLFASLEYLFWFLILEKKSSCSSPSFSPQRRPRRSGTGVWEASCPLPGAPTPTGGKLDALGALAKAQL